MGFEDEDRAGGGPAPMQPRAVYHRRESSRVICVGEAETVRGDRMVHIRQYLGQVGLALVLASVALAGCTAPIPPADLRVSANWQAWESDRLPHLILLMTNLGGEDALVGPGGRSLAIQGPTGNVPIYWGETDFARPVHGGRSVSVAMHPRANDQGVFGLAVDHAWGVAVAPPPGFYRVCIGVMCDAVILTEGMP